MDLWKAIAICRKLEEAPLIFPDQTREALRTVIKAAEDVLDAQRAFEEAWNRHNY
jgi:hypothetical protein